MGSQDVVFVEWLLGAGSNMLLRLLAYFALHALTLAAQLDIAARIFMVDILCMHFFAVLDAAQCIQLLLSLTLL